MEASRLIQQLDQLKSHFDRPMSYMELIRASASPSIAHFMKPDDRKLMSDNLDDLREFLSSEDGADALELFVQTFREFLAVPVE